MLAPLRAGLTPCVRLANGRSLFGLRLLSASSNSKGDSSTAIPADPQPPPRGPVPGSPPSSSSSYSTSNSSSHSSSHPSNSPPNDRHSHVNTRLMRRDGGQSSMYSAGSSPGRPSTNFTAPWMDVETDLHDDHGPSSSSFGGPSSTSSPSSSAAKAVSGWFAAMTGQSPAPSSSSRTGKGGDPREVRGFTKPRVFSGSEKKSLLTLSVTEFDPAGEIKVASGRFSKSDLCATHGLQTRDLRTIDNYKDQMPAILVRSKAIVVNLEHIKALIRADHVVVLDPPEGTDRHHQSLFLADLQERLRSGPSSSSPSPLPYELRALESMLISVNVILRDSFNQLSPKVASILRRMEGRVDKQLLLTMLDVSRKLTRFEARVHAVQAALTEVLNNNDDMAGMYLTYKASTGQAMPAESHEEVEYMFEFYARQIDEMATQTAEFISNIRSTQSIVKIELDSQRNSLLHLELRVTIATFAVSMASMGASLFGMNLLNKMESSATAFAIVTATIGTVSFLVFVVLMRYMRRLVKAGSISLPDLVSRGRGIPMP